MFILNIAFIANTIKFNIERKHIIPKAPKKFLNKNFMFFRKDIKGDKKFIFSR